MGAKTRVKETAGRVYTRLEPVIASEGYELVDVEHVSERGRMVLRMYIDTVPPGDASRGVTVEDCSFVSRLVSDILDVEEILEGRYHLEVSSPGIFRPLTKPEHFARAVGERIKLKTYDKQYDRRVFTGILKRHEGGALEIDVDGTSYEVALDNVAKAHLEPELEF